MKKLIHGILEFRQNLIDDYRKKFSKLALGQRPDVLFVACSDSRVAPNVFASTDPGDTLVLRNIGNIIAPHDQCCDLDHMESSAAAIEFALDKLDVLHIIVCGHSECAAIQTVIDGRDKLSTPALQSWLRHIEPAYDKFKSGFRLNRQLAAHNELSQINVLQQIEHIKTFPIVKEKKASGQLAIHGWWFDLATADVYVYDKACHQFVIIDEQNADLFI